MRREEGEGQGEGAAGCLVVGHCVAGCVWGNQLVNSLTPTLLPSAADMTASAAGSGLQRQRAAVAEAAAAAESARLHLHRRYLEEQPAALEAAGGHADGDFACQAWLHAVLRSADEVRCLPVCFLAGPGAPPVPGHAAACLVQRSNRNLKHPPCSSCSPVQLAAVQLCSPAPHTLARAPARYTCCCWSSTPHTQHPPAPPSVVAVAVCLLLLEPQPTPHPPTRPPSLFAGGCCGSSAGCGAGPGPRRPLGLAAGVAGPACGARLTWAAECSALHLLNHFAATQQPVAPTWRRSLSTPGALLPPFFLQVAAAVKLFAEPQQEAS